MTSEIFQKFERRSIVGDGRSVFDFLGGAILAEYKAGWVPLAEGKELTPGYPGANEWYIDWIACLVTAYLAKDTFRVVELGAGYAQWMVSSVQAFKALNPDGKAHGLALEADEVHYGWMLDHVRANLDKFTDVDTVLLHSAAGRDGTVSFPVLDEPSKNYGASVSKGAAGGTNRDFVTVPSESLSSIFGRLGDDLVDILHIDIQGAEVDLLLEQDVTPELDRTKALMVGTHISDDVHRQLRDLVVSSGFKVIVDWPRNSEVRFLGNSISTNDGAIFAINPRYLDESAVRKLVCG